MIEQTTASQSPAASMALVVQLSQDQLERLKSVAEASSSTPAEYLSVMANSLVSQFLSGAMVIPPEYATRISAALHSAGRPDSPQAVTEAVERQVGRHGESLVVEVRIDPAWAPHLLEVASRQGISLEQHLRNIIDWALFQGWFGAVLSEPVKMLFTPDQYKRLREVLGKDAPTGADLMEWVDSVVEAQSADAALAALFGQPSKHQSEKQDR